MLLKFHGAKTFPSIYFISLHNFPKFCKTLHFPSLETLPLHSSCGSPTIPQSSPSSTFFNPNQPQHFVPKPRSPPCLSSICYSKKGKLHLLRLSSDSLSSICSTQNPKLRLLGLPSACPICSGFFVFKVVSWRVEGGFLSIAHSLATSAAKRNSVRFAPPKTPSFAFWDFHLLVRYAVASSSSSSFLGGLKVVFSLLLTPSRLRQPREIQSDINTA